jgi:hypothetical protein
MLTGKIVRRIADALSNKVNYATVFVPSNNYDNFFSIISCSKDQSNQIVVWDFSHHSPMNQWQCEAVTSLVVYDPKEGDFNPIAIVGDINNNTTIWDLVTIKPLGILGGHTDRINSVAVFPAASCGYEFYLATSSSDKTVIIRRLRKKTTSLSNHNQFLVLQSKTIKNDNFFLCVGFTCFSVSSEPYLFIGGDNKSFESQLWNVNLLLSGKSKEPSVVLKGHKDLVRSVVSFTAKNGEHRLATGSYDNSGTFISFHFYYILFFF